MTTTPTKFFFVYLLSAHPSFLLNTCLAQIFSTAWLDHCHDFTHALTGYSFQRLHTVYRMKFNFLKLAFKGLLALTQPCLCTHFVFSHPLCQSKQPDPLNCLQAKRSHLDHFLLFLHLCQEARVCGLPCLPFRSTRRREVCKHTHAMLSNTPGNLPCPKRSQEKSVNEVTADSLTATWNVCTRARR